MTKNFFDPSEPLDKQLSAGKKKAFLGYNLMQTCKINKNQAAKTIPHNKQRPTFSSISKQRNNFSTFFNSQFKNKNFYDFGTPEMRALKRNICFLGLLYVEADGDLKIDIRQSVKSVKNFKGSNERENLLSDRVTKLVKQNGFDILD